MLHKSASLTKVWRFLSGGGGRDRAAPCRGFLSTLLRSSSEIVISLNLGMPSAAVMMMMMMMACVTCIVRRDKAVFSTSYSR